MCEATGYSELVKALCSTSENLFLPLTLLHGFGIFVCSKGNNKANTVMLNQLPAYIWVHAKHSIPSMAFCAIINSFLKDAAGDTLEPEPAQCFASVLGPLDLLLPKWEW